MRKKTKNLMPRTTRAARRKALNIRFLELAFGA
jgi:hypothetical protein